MMKLNKLHSARECLKARFQRALQLISVEEKDISHPKCLWVLFGLGQPNASSIDEEEQIISNCFLHLHLVLQNIYFSKIRQK